ncbi:cytochrome P450 [Streptomyces sp. NPDC007205]|uniref:cytochrome P450 n=1 Tax=Streptomyces sp. NPDC007205 TaxID=3154316 RepID=UPI0033E51EE7
MTRTLNDIPAAPAGIPFIGHSIRFMRDPIAFLEKLRHNGDFARIRLGPASFLFALSEEAVGDLLSDKAGAFRYGYFNVRSSDLIPNSMLLAYGDEHAERRRSVQPHLRKEDVKNVAELHVKFAQEHMADWTDKQWIDVGREALTFTLRTALHVVFGRQFPADEEVEFRRIFFKTTRLVGYRVLLSLFQPASEVRRLG